MASKAPLQWSQGKATVRIGGGTANIDWAVASNRLDDLTKCEIEVHVPAGTEGYLMSEGVGPGGLKPQIGFIHGLDPLEGDDEAIPVNVFLAVSTDSDKALPVGLRFEPISTNHRLGSTVEERGTENVAEIYANEPDED